MAKKKEIVDLPTELDEQPETKEVEIVQGKSLGGVEKKVTQKLVSRKVFEAMQGIHKTIWVKQ